MHLFFYILTIIMLAAIWIKIDSMRTPTNQEDEAARIIISNKISAMKEQLKRIIS